MRLSELMTPKFRILLGTLFLTVPIDQLSKWWVETHVDIGDRLAVIDGFLYLTHARNAGAAFGLFETAPASLRLFIFVTVSAVAMAAIAFFFQRLAPRERQAALALGLILGGAIGNLIDRIIRTEVVDFLQLQLWGGYLWPDFNCADGFIVVGVAALILDLLAAEAAARTEATHPSDS